MRIWYLGRIRAICLLAVFCQQGELGLCPIRGALKCRIQGFLYRRFRNGLRSFAPVSDSADCHAKVLGE